MIARSSKGRSLTTKGEVKVRKPLFGISLGIACLAAAVIAIHLRRVTFAGHTGPVRFGMTISQDGRTLASMSDDRTIRLWNTVTGGERVIIQEDARSVLFSPDGNTLASLNQCGEVKLWKAASGEERLTFQRDALTDDLIAFSPEGLTLATLSSDKTIRLWDAGTGNAKGTLRVHACWGSSVAFSPDWKTLASAEEDATITLWDVGTGQLRATLPGHRADFAPGIMGLAFSPDGRTLASAGYWANAKLWELSTGKCIATLDTCEEACHSTVIFSPDSKTLASVGIDDRIKIWDVASGTEITSFEFGYRPPFLPGIFEGCYERVWSISFRPDGKLVAFLIAERGDRSKIMREVLSIPNGSR
jgi:WD40 repeat protein